MIGVYIRDWLKGMLDEDYESIERRMALHEQKINMLVEATTEAQFRINHLMGKSYNTAPIPFVDKPYWHDYGSMRPSRWGYKGIVNNVESYVWAEHYSDGSVNGTILGDE